MINNIVYSTGETENDLRRTYNPDGSTIRKAQLRMLNMLLYIDNICKELNISYFIEGGNLLGAVRHGGFIPWDDDMDIDMTRKDFRKLCNYLLLNPHPQYVLQIHRTDKGFFSPWAVLRDKNSEYVQDSLLHNVRKYKGLQIDIFPLEKAPYTIFRKIGSVLDCIKDSYFLGSKPFLCNCLFFIMHKVLFPLFRIIDKTNPDKTYYTYCYGHGNLKKFDKDILYPTKKILFEGHTVSSPNNTESYLRILFGNYMNLPPKDSRNHHSIHEIIFHE